MHARNLKCHITICLRDHKNSISSKGKARRNCIDLIVLSFKKSYRSKLNLPEIPQKRSMNGKKGGRSRQPARKMNIT